MANLPGVKEIRLFPIQLVVVTIVFSENMGTLPAASAHSRKIKSVQISPKVRNTKWARHHRFGRNISARTGCKTRLRGSVFGYGSQDNSGLDSAEAVIRNKRRVEVNSWGGYPKQYEVAVKSCTPASAWISAWWRFWCVGKQQQHFGRCLHRKNAESYFIRGGGQVKSLEDIEKLWSKPGGVPVLDPGCSNSAFPGYANRFGARTANGEGEKVLGQIMMLKNANSKMVISEAKAG